MERIDRLADVCVLVSCDVAATTVAQRQDGRHVTRRLVIPEVPPDESAHVFGQRHAKLGGPLPRSPMLLWLQRDLRSLYHDGAIILPARTSVTPVASEAWLRLLGEGGVEELDDVRQRPPRADLCDPDQPRGRAA